jgi:hypothetical protein
MDGGAVSKTKLIAVRERCDLCVDTTTITEAVSQDDSPQFSAARDDASFVPCRSLHTRASDPSPLRSWCDRLTSQAQPSETNELPILWADRRNGLKLLQCWSDSGAGSVMPSRRQGLAYGVQPDFRADLLSGVLSS